MSNQALGTRPTDEPRQSKKAPTWSPLQDFFRKHDLAQCSKSGNKVVGTSYTPRPVGGAQLRSESTEAPPENGENWSSASHPYLAPVSGKARLAFP
jgi:hypothetical protein